MLVVGIALRNLFDDVFFVLPLWSVTLRRAAFVVILLRGGLSLDADALNKLKGACLRLCFIPCSVEAVVVAATSWLLLNMDVLYGLLLGFVLAAVSPAVIVPAMVDAQNHCYGTDSGVPTLIVASASLDDVYAITMFSILLSIVFSTGDSVSLTLLKAPVEVLSGIFFGAICGFVLRYVPGPTQKNKSLIRFCMLFTMSLAWLLITISLRVDSIGAIAVLVTAFVAGIHWKKEGSLPTEGQLSVAWKLFFEPCLFGLIGFELSLDIVSWSVIGWGSVVLASGLILRTISAFLVVFGAGFNIKEQLFIAISWIPKATVQAALAPLALDIARSRTDLPAVYTDNGVIIFTIAVLSILTTAPLGAFIIRLCTPILLKKVYPKVSIELNH
ncbi:unnamed protein product [Auanema sp. JU1783]|nr:unnamed protein product [Auanema sp. JU1783]